MTDPRREALLLAGWRESEGRWLAPVGKVIVNGRNLVDGSRRITLEDAVTIERFRKQLNEKRKP